ncbi:MAG: hypothetical protein H6Q14_230 [Bacteroidetes bacterium]|jgi:hypothetical protein|nr:hypothetical protein [Bacteroidota bacterium]
MLILAIGKALFRDLANAFAKLSGLLLLLELIRHWI